MSLDLGPCGVREPALITSEIKDNLCHPAHPKSPLLRSECPGATWAPRSLCPPQPQGQPLHQRLEHRELPSPSSPRCSRGRRARDVRVVADTSVSCHRLSQASWGRRCPLRKVPMALWERRSVTAAGHSSRRHVATAPLHLSSAEPGSELSSCLSLEGLAVILLLSSVILGLMLPLSEQRCSRLIHCYRSHATCVL